MTGGPGGPHTPAQLAEVAAEAVRALNHATLPRAGGLVFPADAYTVLASLAVLAARLPQALAQVQHWLDAECEAGRITVVAGEHAGDTVAAITTCAHFTDAAAAAAHALHDALERAQAALTWAAAVEPAESSDEPDPDVAGPEGI